jgi:hypothetical protein
MKKPFLQIVKETIEFFGDFWREVWKHFAKKWNELPYWLEFYSFIVGWVLIASGFGLYVLARNNIVTTIGVPVIALTMMAFGGIIVVFVSWNRWQFKGKRWHCFSVALAAPFLVYSVEVLELCGVISGSALFLAKFVTFMFAYHILRVVWVRYMTR